MKILVVSGFLGAGKTTFIKELLKRVKRNIVIMENEYGQTNLDIKELSKGSDLEVLEFMEGCVCCTMKDSFVNSVLTIQSTLDPEYLIIEPTGIAKLSNLLSNIEKISYEKIVVLKPVLVLCPSSYYTNLYEYKDIYEDQIRNASTIIFSKIESVDRNYIKEISHEIKSINPQIEIIDEHYSKKENEFFENLFTDKNDLEIKEINNDEVSFEQVSIKNANLQNLGQLILLLQDIIYGNFGKIVRAKGVLKINDEFIRFDIADNMYGIIGCESQDCQCVFIGKNIKEEKLYQRLNTSVVKEKIINHISNQDLSNGYKRINIID